MRSINKIHTITLFACAGILGSLIGSCTRKGTNEKHCFRNDGDDYCKRQHPDAEEHRWYCVEGSCAARYYDPQPDDGCVAELVADLNVEECYFPCGGAVSMEECMSGTTTGTGTEMSTGSSTETTGTGTETDTETGSTSTDTSTSDTTGPECTMEGQEDSMCKDMGTNEPYCVGGECVSCTDAGDNFCKDDKPACDSASGLCVECTAEESGKCEKTTPICLENNICGCAKEEDIIENKDVFSEECPPTTPICGVQNQECRKCQEHSECPSGACHIKEGTCFPDGEENVIWVDKNAGACPGNGKKESPFCKLTNGVAAVVDANPKTIRLRGGITEGDAYDEQVSIDGGKVIAIIGEPNMEVEPRITATNNFLATVAISGVNTFAYLARVHISNNTLKGGITCDNGAEMWVSESHVDGNQGTGISGTSCTVTLHESHVDGNQKVGDMENFMGIAVSNSSILLLDRSTVIGNDGGGIEGKQMSTIKIVNSVIGSNGFVNGETRGLAVDSGSTFDVLYSTIAANLGESSINCLSNTTGHKIRNSIVGTHNSNSIKNCEGKVTVTTSGIDTKVGQIVPLMYDSKWFKNVGVDFSLSGTGEGQFMECAVWKAGVPEDPRIDIDGTIRPWMNVDPMDGDLDFCGAYVPK